jgi:ABC-type sugar transport system substrate-binding protein
MGDVNANPKIEVVAEQAPRPAAGQGQTAFAPMPRALPNQGALWGNDMMAAGARPAAKGAGKEDGDIRIFGADRLPGPAGRIRGRRGSVVGNAQERRDRHGLDSFGAIIVWREIRC